MKSFVPAQSFRIEDFQDQVSDWLWGTDDNGVLVYSNKRIDDYFLPPDGNYLGLNFISLVRSLLSQRETLTEIPVENLQQLFNSQSDFSNIVVRCMGENEQELRLILKGKACFDRCGAFQGYKGVGRIELTNVEAQEGGANLDTLMMAAENSSNGVIITDENGEIRYANPGSCEITGYSREECYGQTPRLFRSGHTSLSVYSNFWNTLLQGKTWRGTVYNKHKSGEYFWCREVVSPVLRQDGSISNFVAVQEDVTFRLIAEEELKKSEERFKEFAEAASDWFWETDPNLKIVYISDNTKECIGGRLEALLQQSLVVGDQEGDPELWAGLLEKLTAKQPFKDYVHVFTRNDGQKCRWQISGEPCYASDEEFIGYHGVGKDITSWTELEEKLDQSRKMEKVGQRAGGIAHDFNNLLGIIMGNAELLKEKYEQANVVVDPNVENIIYASKRGINISNQLLVFSRKQNLNPELVDLNLQLSQMMEILKSSVGENVHIDLEVDSDLWPCFVDEDHLVNSILNLSINSRDAMHDEGVLTISMENKSIEQDMSAKDISKGDYVVITIADTGDGISKENLQKVYEPFYSSKAHGKGTGLGLSMVYGFAKKSDGAIWIESTVGEGTMVHLYLPKFNGQSIQQSEHQLSAGI